MANLQDSSGSGNAGSGGDLIVNIGANIDAFVTGLQTALSDMQGFAATLGSLPLPDIFAPIVTSIDNGDQWIADTGLPAFTAEIQAMADSVPVAFAGVTEAIVNPIRAALAQIAGLSVTAPTANGGGNPSGGLPTFADGGYTGNGPASAVAGIVHSGEFVVPQNGALVLHDGQANGASNVTITGPIYVQGVQDAGALLDALLREAKRRNKTIG